MNFDQFCKHVFTEHKANQFLSVEQKKVLKIIPVYICTDVRSGYCYGVCVAGRIVYMRDKDNRY